MRGWAEGGRLHRATKPERGLLRAKAGGKRREVGEGKGRGMESETIGEKEREKMRKYSMQKVHGGGSQVGGQRGADLVFSYYQGANECLSPPA